MYSFSFIGIVKSGSDADFDPYPKWGHRVFRGNTVALAGDFNASYQSGSTYFSWDMVD